MTELRLEAVSRTYPGAVPVKALREAELVIRQGDFVAIEGPSGVGKSTLLNVLALLDTPTAGQYLIDDVPATDLDDGEAARMRARTFGFVFQSFHLIPHRSAVENVMLGLAYQGATVDHARRRALRALDFVGLSHPATCRWTVCPEASASAWRSPGLSAVAHRCSWPTSRPATSTPPPRRQ